MSELLSEMASTLARRENERIDYALRGAVLAGYDGVDINKTPPHPLTSTSVIGVQSIIPWKGDPPKSDNEYRTTRYTWDWFSDDTLNEIARTGEVPAWVKYKATARTQ